MFFLYSMIFAVLTDTKEAVQWCEKCY